MENKHIDWHKFIDIFGGCQSLNIVPRSYDHSFEFKYLNLNGNLNNKLDPLNLPINFFFLKRR